MDNPVAYITEYKKCLIDILSILLGRPASSFVSKDDGDTVRRTQYFEDCCKGILGHMIAWYLVNEDHSKGTLHSHLIGWGGLPPRVLQMAGGIQNLCDAVSKMLDSQYVARLEPQRLVTKIFHRTFQKYSFRISSGPSKPPVLLSSLQRHENFLRNTRHDATAQQSAMPVHFAEFSGDMNTITEDQRARQQFHEHMFTCQKGVNGFTGCRLCKPSNLCKMTRPVLLTADNIVDPETNKVSLGPVVATESIPLLPIIPTSDIRRRTLFNPLQKPDSRLVVWELKRPNISDIIAEYANLDNVMDAIVNADS
jgi:hypothetical protein